MIQSEQETINKIKFIESKGYELSYQTSNPQVNIMLSLKEGFCFFANLNDVFDFVVFTEYQKKSLAK